MKKLVSIIPLSVALAACATGPMNGTSQTNTNKAYDRMMPQPFVCEDDAKLHVKYSIDGSQATITANVPKAQWNNQTIILDQAVSGSGARYVNNDSNKVAYEWHGKADMGIFSMTWKDDNSTYSVNCKALS